MSLWTPDYPKSMPVFLRELLLMQYRHGLMLIAASVVMLIGIAVALWRFHT